MEAKKLSGTRARLVVRFTVTHGFINLAGILLGGAQASIHDVCTTWAVLILRRPGFWDQEAGSSRTLAVTFLRPAKEGEVLLEECEVRTPSRRIVLSTRSRISQVVQAGKRLALIRATMKRESDGAVISTCEHNKYHTDGDKARM